jgi:hypothetical protein
VVDEIVGEEFVEEYEIALALDLFGVAADHGLDVGWIGVGHSATCLSVV